MGLCMPGICCDWYIICGPWDAIMGWPGMVPYICGCGCGTGYGTGYGYCL